MRHDKTGWPTVRKKRFCDYAQIAALDSPVRVQCGLATVMLVHRSFSNCQRESAKVWWCCTFSVDVDFLSSILLRESGFARLQMCTFGIDFVHLLYFLPNSFTTCHLGCKLSTELKTDFHRGTFLTCKLFPLRRRQNPVFTNPPPHSAVYTTKQESFLMRADSSISNEFHIFCLGCFGKNQSKRFRYLPKF